MGQIEFDASKRQFLKNIVALGGGLALAGCGVGDPRTQTTASGVEVSPVPSVTEGEVSSTEHVATIVTETVVPTETAVPTEVLNEQERVELWKQRLENAPLVTQNTLVKVIGVVEDPYPNTTGYHWMEAPESYYPSRLVRLDDVEFNVVGIEAEYIPGFLPVDDSYIYRGYIPNMTGDPSRWLVQIGSYYPNIKQTEEGVFYFEAKPLFDDQGARYSGIEERYGTMAQRTWYDSKVANVLIGLEDFRRNALMGIAPGQEFSFLGTLDLAKYMKEDGHYHLGLNAQGEWVIGGGVCAFDTVVAKAVHRAIRSGVRLEVTEIQEHSSGPYFVNFEDRDTVDATSAITTGGTVVDYRFVNRTDRTLFFVPKVDILFPEMSDGRRLHNSMETPATVRFVMSMTLTDKRPTLADSQSVTIAREAFFEFRKKYGNGYIDGFDS